MYKENINKRVEWIKLQLEQSGAKGIVVGNSGGKDCTLVLALCKMATDNVLSVIMPCESSRNYTIDREDAIKTCEKFGIKNIEIDLSDAKMSFRNALKDYLPDKNSMAYANINPRLRMITLYALAQQNNYLVAGTGNLSEYTMGYFTKWGDGAHDFNPIADLKVSEIFEYLKELGAPESIITKAPSAGLYEGQTDEGEMGVTYAEIDQYIDGIITKNHSKIALADKRSNHKKQPIPKFCQK